MHTRPCWVEIDTRALEKNYRFLASLAAPHAELLAMVKADAYGHSLPLCAPAAVRAGARWLGVTSVEEGVAARAACPEPNILVISGSFPGQGADVVRNRLTSVVWEPFHLDELEAAAVSAGLSPCTLPVHLEIDTGMSRQGADLAHLAPLLARFTATSPLWLEGIMTHLYAADESDERVTHEQLDRLGAALDKIRAAGIQLQLLNVGNSAALLAAQTPLISAIAQRFNMNVLMRPGLALYGLAPAFDPPFTSDPAPLSEAHQKLQSVLTWKTKVVSVRAIPAGASVGYNGTFIASEPMRIALLAVGYADGLDRRLGNRFSLLVRGQRAPLVGRVSMDQAVLDVTEIPSVEPGDEVVLIGSQGDARITAEEHAAASGTISWEVFTSIGSRVARIPV